MAYYYYDRLFKDTNPCRRVDSVRQWLLWTFRCRRGRRCADVVFTELQITGVPPGAIGIIQYVCGGCGTHYRRSTLAGEGGTFTSGDRERVA